MANRIQYRRDTAANWTAANPVLALGEPGWETDTKKRKVGDGTTAWTGLGYQLDKAIADSIYSTRTATRQRPATIASLGDSIACNGSAGMAVVALTAAASAGATTITVTAAEASASMPADFPSGTLIMVGTEYTATTGAPASAGANWTLTLTAGLTATHPAGEQVISIPTVYTGSVNAAFGASILSKGRLKYAGAYGHGSYTADQCKRLYIPLILAAKPGYCYVMAGRNPGVNSADYVAGAAAVVELWDLLLAGGVMPIATTIPPVPGSTSQNKQDDQKLNAILVAQARKRGIPLTDFFALAVNPATGEYLSTVSDMANGNPHPNDAGRVVQAQGIWDAISAFVPNEPSNRPVTNAYPNTAVYPLPATQTNAMMLSGGGTVTGSGSTSVLPAGWNAAILDVNGVSTRPAAPIGAGNAIKLSRAAGSSSGTNLVKVATDSGTLIAGHRYLFSCDIQTNGLTAAQAAAGYGNTYARLTVTNAPTSGTTTFLNIDRMYQDFSGTIHVEFVTSAAQPTTGLVMLTLNGVAASPAYDVTMWNVMITDLTALGLAADSPWPYQPTP